MTTEIPIFHRPVLAQQIVQRTLSSNGRSGVFISAPRRTGKSTFIIEDIIPSLKTLKAEVIYVDLWSDRSRDPGDLIAEAVREHLQKREGVLLQWARKGGLDKINVGGVSVDIAKVGIGTGKTLAKALADLSDATQAVIVLVIDEAQHAITTEAGANALYALKAARDQLNGSAHNGFRLIATGSNRDKLSMLVNGKDQAFLNAVLFDLEPLGKDFVEWELSQYGEGIAPSLATVESEFIASGHKPETLHKALDDLAFRFNVTESNVDSEFRSIFSAINLDSKQNFMRQVNSLPPLQASVLVVMATTGADYAPFRPATVQKYKALCKKFSTSEVVVDDSSIQYALEALRKKTLVWNSARGVYAIEDSQHVVWLKEEFPAVTVE
ncbi:AAA family ATPase [Undibacterium sp. Di27W]|uniref:AAA family ATPase n=1 Tax=Undibacterium sp. Di27W TaxID=3413036 RepID=UPI003BF11429